MPFLSFIAEYQSNTNLITSKKLVVITFNYRHCCDIFKIYDLNYLIHKTPNRYALSINIQIGKKLILYLKLYRYSICVDLWIDCKSIAELITLSKVIKWGSYWFFFKSLYEWSKNEYQSRLKTTSLALVLPV